MDNAALFALCFAIGIVAGLRCFTAPGVVAWGVRLHWVDVSGMWAAFLGSGWALAILTALALFELFNDKRPGTPSRKAPPSFALRVLMGAFSGAALAGSARGSSGLGAVCGVLGAVAGTLGGYEARTRTVREWHVPDMPIALIEDAVAIGAGLLFAALAG